MTDKDNFKGYRGKAVKLLKKFDAFVWSDVEIETVAGKYFGLILPRSETADEFHIVLKMSIGYNIGIAVNKIKTIKVNGRKEAHYNIPEKEFPYHPD